MKFEFLEHTADVKMRVFGKTPKELFCNAVEGMAALQFPISKFQIPIKSQIPKSKITPPSLSLDKGRKGGVKIKKLIKVKSESVETLLVDFLSAVLTQSDIENAVFSEAKIKKLTETEIEAEIFGTKVERFKEDIKAVTYHGVEVKKKDNFWQTEVLFDV